MFVCPCCGYDKIDVLPYSNILSVRKVEGLSPPYQSLLGNPSYEVCPCCHFEYGFDDNPGGDSKGLSFGDHLWAWVIDGMQWLDEAKKPSNWALSEQLLNLKIYSSILPDNF